MKKIILVVCCSVITYLSFSQISSKEYNDLLAKAKSFYNSKDFSNAASVYSSALRAGGGLVTSYNRWTGACYCMAANQPDSAYLQLSIIAESNNMDFTDLLDMFSDNECFSTLYSQQRWKDIKEKTFLNFYRRYVTEIQGATGKEFKSKQNEKDLATALSNNENNFFAHLNDQAYEFLKKKMYNKACRFGKVSIKYFPQNYLYYNDVGNFYQAMGDAERAFAYYSRGLNQKFKNLVYNIDTSLNFDSLISADYKLLAQQFKRKAIPTDVSLFILANALLRKDAKDKAYRLCKMNIENHPVSVLANRGLSNYYKATGDKENEDKFVKLAQQYTPQPPARNPSQDLQYDASVTTPSCLSNCPVILFDAAHINYHTASGRYKPFAELMRNAGFVVTENHTPFTKEMLAKINVVIIASPNGTIIPEEVEVLKEWISKGGSLFAITDHDNFSFDVLLESLGVIVPETNFTDDSVHARIMRDGITRNPRHLVFSQKDKLLGSHPIINGENSAEKINVVKTFSGRPIIAPSGSSVLLQMSEAAISYLTIEPTQRGPKNSVAVKSTGTKVFGTAFEFGKGKVVAVSEAAMLTVQAVDGGFNTSDCDNKQFALNIMRWLTGYLK